MSATRTEATVRIREAMKRVELAQNELDHALQLLSAITYWAPEYSATGKMRERVHALWWRLARKLEKGGKYDLDSSATATFLAGSAR